MRLELTFASKEDSLTVRTFQVREELSGLFEIELLARSSNDDIDLGAIVGKGAAFRISGPNGRLWNGLCSQMQMIQTESTGVSTYSIRIAPAFWRTTLRRNNRIFQHKTIPEIVKAVCEDWKIQPELRLRATYPSYEYKVQYGETDYDFIARLLEEAGITYFFAYGDGASAAAQTHLVLSDSPEKAEGRAPLHYIVDHTTRTSTQEWVSHVRLSQRVTPGHVTIRDYDFRTKADYQLSQEAKAGAANEVSYEHYDYVPGAFVVEPGKASDTPVADDKGVARVDEKFGKDLATRRLDALRRGALRVSLRTVATDLWPGQVFAIKDHPRRDLSEAHKLLVTSARHEGGDGVPWSITVEAGFTNIAYRPERKTPKPRVIGVQSAIVVGPKDEEIHTDELGRVRVKFHWDREGAFDDFASCWMRVSQAWAGFGYGAIMIPRVGHEVLVDFFEGDPDQPVVVGRVFNNTTRVPYKLPENKTKSGWKSNSSPGSGGFNEISLEDAKDRERIHIQAQRDFSEIVKHDQSSIVLNDRSSSVAARDDVIVGVDQSIDIGNNQRAVVGTSQTTHVGRDRTTLIGESDAVEIGRIYSVTVGPGSGLSIDGDNRTIVLTTNGATIVLGRDFISLDAKSDIRITAGGTLKLSGEEVQIDGRPNVYVNSKGAADCDLKRVSPAKKPEAPRKPLTGGESSVAAPKLAGRGAVEGPAQLMDAVAKSAPPRKH
jgi:type VI secretion system secreted protein VgrG